VQVRKPAGTHLQSNLSRLVPALNVLAKRSCCQESYGFEICSLLGTGLWLHTIVACCGPPLQSQSNASQLPSHIQGFTLSEAWHALPH